MTENPPDPLVPAEVDLTDFQYMELDVQRLRDSRFAAESEPEAFRAGVLLWCASWHQVPAASLPNNDRELSNLAGFGRVVKEWRKVREQALALFVLCSDGRLYHRIVAEKAIAAWNSKLQHHYDRARDRLRKLNKQREGQGLTPLPELSFEAWNAQRLAAKIPMEKADAGAGIPPPAPPPSGGIPAENALRGNRTERERRGNGDSSVPTGTDAGASKLTPEQAAALTKAELWAAGKSLLLEQKMPAAQCGTFVGKLVKDYDEAIVVDAVRAAVLEQPADAASWLKAACQARAGQRKRNGAPPTQAELDAINEEATRLVLGGKPTANMPHSQEAINA